MSDILGTGYKRDWFTLPPISRGYTRVPDAPDGTRMCVCEICGQQLPTLGIGYHQKKHPV